MTQKCLDIVTRTVWNTFYDQVWRVHCEKIQDWEKKTNITNKMKKGARVKEKLDKEKGRNIQAEEITNREALIKGLTIFKVKKRLE